MPAFEAANYRGWMNQNAASASIAPPISGLSRSFPLEVWRALGS